MIRLNLLQRAKPAKVIRRAAPMMTMGSVLLLLAVCIILLMIGFHLMRSLWEKEAEENMSVSGEGASIYCPVHVQADAGCIEGIGQFSSSCFLSKGTDDDVKG
jgi:hypothetical protein